MLDLDLSERPQTAGALWVIDVGTYSEQQVEESFLLLDAETRLAAAKASLPLTRVDYQNAVAAVEYATGNLLEGYQVQGSDMTK